MREQADMPKQTWGERAEMFARGAERARVAGDQVAMIVLLKGASQCAQIARLLEQPADDASPQGGCR